MRLPLPTVILAAALTGCVVHPAPPVDPCLVDGQNPCTQANRTACVVESGAARCLCNEGFLSRPSGACEAISSGNCPEHQGDGAEPDDCMAKARAISTSDEPRAQSIDPVGDYDFISFNATARHVFVITAQGQGALFPRIDAYDQGGQWLASDERTGKAQLSLKAPATAPLFVRVSQSPLDPSVATGSYSLTFATSGQEDHGDGPTEASSISAQAGASPSSIDGRFEVPGDQDWFSFSGSTQQNYRLSFDSARGPAPLVALYTAGDLEQAKWTAQQPIIDFDLTAGETAYLAIYAPAELGSYRFTFTRTAK